MRVVEIMTKPYATSAKGYRAKRAAELLSRYPGYYRVDFAERGDGPPSASDPRSHSICAIDWWKMGKI